MRSFRLIKRHSRQRVGRARLALQPYEFAATGIRLDGSEFIKAIDLLKQFVDVQELHEKDREQTGGQPRHGLLDNRGRRRPSGGGGAKLADGVGFEPTRRLRACRFSRPVPSTTRPPIHAWISSIFALPLGSTKSELAPDWRPGF